MNRTTAPGLAKALFFANRESEFRSAVWTAGCLNGNTAETARAILGGDFWLRLLFFETIHLLYNHKNGKGNDEEV